MRDAAYPLLVASQAIPIPVIAPLLIIAFDYGIGPKIAIVALVCFFPIVVNLADGLRATPPDLMKMMRSLGASRDDDPAQGRAAERAAPALHRPARSPRRSP